MSVMRVLAREGIYREVVALLLLLEVGVEL